MLQSLKMPPQILDSNSKMPEGVVPNMPGNTQQIDQAKLELLEKSSFDNFSSQNYQGAIKDLKELVKMNPMMRSGYENNIGMCYVELNNYKKALEHFNESLKADPKNVNALSGASEMYLKLNQKDRAIQTFKQILALYPDNEFAKNKIDSLTKK